MSTKVTLFWYRRDLRHYDNTGLHYALKEGNPVLPVFIFDTQILDDLDDKKDARLTFIHDAVTRLHQFFSDKGGSMLIRHGDPVEVFRSLVRDFDIESVYTNRDYEPYAQERDQKVKEICESNGVNFYSYKDQVIYEQGEILTGSDTPYKVFTPYKNKWMEKFKDMKLSEFSINPTSDQLYNQQEFDLPSLESIGFERSEVAVPDATFPEEVIKNYYEKRNFPAENGTTRLGVHLRHGTVSVRHAVRVGSKLSESWLNELIWREFYMMILAHFPHVVDGAFKREYDQIPWENDPEKFERWCNGKTGYPIVDAGMRELNQTGYMHNRVRMIVASFLTKHLLIDWRWGEQYFAKKLLDYELSSNNGGWQWAAGSGTDAQPYFRVFNPYTQTDKFDKNKSYVRKWVPEYGTDKYPEPIVDHKFARERAISTYKDALQ
jgi:deoxyribodipyrimidine photo-lyase